MVERLRRSDVASRYNEQALALIKSFFEQGKVVKKLSVIGQTKNTRGLRIAVRGDVPVILQLVHALADYEREPDAVEEWMASLRP